MVDRIQLRRTNTPSAVPTNTDLIAEGEVALNLQDRLMFYRDAAGNIQTLTIADLSGFTTDDLAEGTALYYTDEKVDDRVATLLQEGTGITITYDDNANTLTITRDPIVDADIVANAAISADKLNVASTSTKFFTVQHLQDVFHSAGLAEGGEITDAGAGQISVAAGHGLTRVSGTQNDVLKFMEWPTTVITLTDQSLNYVYVTDNETVTASITEPSTVENVYLGTVHRDGTTLHITNSSKYQVGDHASLMIKRLQKLMPFARESGATISFNGLNISLTAGTFWEGLNQFTTPAFDSAVTPFNYYYTDAGDNWIVNTSNTIDPSNYDAPGGGLVGLSPNQYGVHWVFLDPEGDVYVVYGTASYANLAAAQAAGVRADLPPFFDKHVRIVGKVINERNAATIFEASSPFTSTFTASAATDHGSLAGLGDDDHPQYYNESRGDARYAKLVGPNTIAGTNTFTGTVNFSNGLTNTTLNTPIVKGERFTVFDIGTTSGTIAPNVTNGNIQSITLNGNLTLNAFTTPLAGQKLTLIVKQDATGGRTLLATAWNFTESKQTLSTAPNAVDIIEVFYDGTAYWATLYRDTPTITSNALNDLTDVNDTTGAAKANGDVIYYDANAGEYRRLPFTSLLNSLGSVGGLGDVNLFNLAANDVLAWDGNSWDNKTPAAFLSEQSTDNLPEGTNLYFTDERVDDRVASLITWGYKLTGTYNDVGNTLTVNWDTVDIGELGDVSDGLKVSGSILTWNGTNNWVASAEPFDELVDDRVANLLTAGTNITLTYDDVLNTLTIDAAGGTAPVDSVNGQIGVVVLDTDDVAEGVNNLYFTDERVDDRVAALLVEGSNITLTYDDVANTLTIAGEAAGVSNLVADNGIFVYDEGVNTVIGQSLDTTRKWPLSGLDNTWGTTVPVDYSAEKWTNFTGGKLFNTTTVPGQFYASGSDTTPTSAGRYIDVSAYADLIDAGLMTINWTTSTTIQGGLGDAGSYPEGKITATYRDAVGGSTISSTVSASTGPGVATPVPLSVVETVPIGTREIVAIMTASWVGIGNYALTIDDHDIELVVVPAEGYTSADFDVDFATKSTTNLTEGTNLYFTDARANAAIDTRVTKAFIDALNVDADTLDGLDSTAFATSAQGALANTALQSADIGVTIQGYSAVLAGTTASFTLADETKLDGIETGATADQTASEILAALLTVDGATSLLDADLLDSQEGTFYLDYNNFTNTPSIPGNEEIDDRVANLLVAGTNITLTYNDIANTLTIDAAGGGGGATTLDELTDVVLTAPATGEVLRYNGTNWVDAVLSTSDVTEGTNLYYTDSRVTTLLGTTSINALSDVDTVTAAPADGDVLVWNATDGEWQPGTPASGGGGISAAILYAQDADKVFSATITFEDLSFDSSAELVDADGIATIGTGTTHVTLQPGKYIITTYLAGYLNTTGSGGLPRLEVALFNTNSGAILGEPAFITTGNSDLIFNTGSGRQWPFNMSWDSYIDISVATGFNLRARSGSTAWSLRLGVMTGPPAAQPIQFKILKIG